MLVYCDPTSLLLSPQEVNCTRPVLLDQFCLQLQSKTYFHRTPRQEDAIPTPSVNSTALGNNRYHRYCKFDELVDVLSHAIWNHLQT